MSAETKNGFFKTRAGAIKKTCLVAMLVIPFGLYFSASAGSSVLTYLLLGLMGLTMALTMKAG